MVEPLIVASVTSRQDREQDVCSPHRQKMGGVIEAQTDTLVDRSAALPRTGGQSIASPRVRYRAPS